MKTISAVALLAAPVAFILVPLSFELSVSLLFAAGFALIALVDYARTSRPLPVDAAPVRKERFGLAA